MTVSKDIIERFNQDHEKVTELRRIKAKMGAKADCKRSFGEAKDILLTMKDYLQEARDADHCVKERDELIYTIMKCTIFANLGVIYILLEKDSSIGFDYLNKSLEILEDHVMRPELVFMHIDVLIMLSTMYLEICNYEEAFEVLSDAEQIYWKCKDLNIYPLRFEEVCRDENDWTEEQIQLKPENSLKHLEMLYTLINLHRSEIHIQLEEADEAIRISYPMFTRVLQMGYDPGNILRYILATAKFHMTMNMCKEARQLLALATVILNRIKKHINRNDDTLTEEERSKNMKQFQEQYSMLAAYWVKYGLCILFSRKKKTTRTKKRLLCDNEFSNNNTKGDKEPKKILSGYDLLANNEEIEFPEHVRVTCDYCVHFTDDKKVYHFVVKKEYYKIDTIRYITEYCEILRNYAALYEIMAFSQTDPNNQSMMQKRRAKYYEELIDALDPTTYLDIYRECTFGVGMAYTAIFDKNIDSLVAGVKLNPRELQKLEAIRMKAIEHFYSFIETYSSTDEKSSNGVKDRIELTVMFCVYLVLGHLYYKTNHTDDPKVKIMNLTKCLECYKTFIAKCSQRDDIAKMMKEDIDFSKEMVKLLPLEISSLQHCRIHRLEVNEEKKYVS